VKIDHWPEVCTNCGMVLLINRCQPVTLWSFTGHGLVLVEEGRVVMVSISKPGLHKIVLGLYWILMLLVEVRVLAEILMDSVAAAISL